MFNLKKNVLTIILLMFFTQPLEAQKKEEIYRSPHPQGGTLKFSDKDPKGAWYTVHYITLEGKKYALFNRAADAGFDLRKSGATYGFGDLGNRAFSKRGKYGVINQIGYIYEKPIDKRNPDDELCEEYAYNKYFLNIIDMTTGCILTSQSGIYTAGEWSESDENIWSSEEYDFEINIDSEEQVFNFSTEEYFIILGGSNNLRLCKQYKYPQYNFPLFTYKNEKYRFEGKINHYPIRLFIKADDDNNIEGKYAYLDEDGDDNVYISLSGELKNNRLYLTERVGEVITGHFELTLGDEALSGIWFKKERSKYLKVELDRT